MVNGNSNPNNVTAEESTRNSAVADDNSNCDKDIGKGVGGISILSEAKTANNGHSNSVEARNNRRVLINIQSIWQLSSRSSSQFSLISSSTRRKTRSSVNNPPTDMLEQQMLSVINAGVKGGKKVKSTREIVEELAARSHSPGLVSRTTAASSGSATTGYDCHSM